MANNLKKTREEQKLTVEEVSEKLKIRKQYIIALEEDRWEDIPGEAYRNGYLKMYCKFLKLPYSESVETESEQKETKEVKYDINPKQRLNIALGLILILTIFVWYLIYNRLHDQDGIAEHLENVDHKHYLVDPENNTNIELKQ